MSDHKKAPLWAEGPGRFKADFEAALAERRISVLYQPRFNLASARLCGAEALVRWEHPELGLLDAADFVILAEKNGAAGELDAFVIEAACRQLKTWEAGGTLPSAFYMAVNVSALDFGDPGFARRTGSAIERLDADPARLRLELTCTAVGPSRTLEVATELRALGAGLDLDYFGVGFIALSHLQRLDVGRAGVHPSFLNEGGPRRHETARAIVQMFHKLGVVAVGKGIESEEMLGVFKGLGCDEGQGYYLGRPVSSAVLEALLRDTPRG